MDGEFLPLRENLKTKVFIKESEMTPFIFFELFMKFYNIKDDFITYLRQFDSKVSENKNKNKNVT